MTRDRLSHGAPERDPALPPEAKNALRRVSLLRLASGALALALIAAIWIVWRWG